MSRCDSTPLQDASMHVSFNAFVQRLVDASLLLPSHGQTRHDAGGGACIPALSPMTRAIAQPQLPDPMMQTFSRVGRVGPPPRKRMMVVRSCPGDRARERPADGNTQLHRPATRRSPLLCALHDAICTTLDLLCELTPHELGTAQTPLVQEAHQLVQAASSL